MNESSRATGLRTRLENGDVVLGISEDAYSPALVELYGELGLDFVWIDFEHAGPSPWDGTMIEQLLRASELTGTELLVRVPVNEPALVRKTLDAGVRNCSSRTSIPRTTSAVSCERHTSLSTANPGSGDSLFRGRVAGGSMTPTRRPRTTRF